MSAASQQQQQQQQQVAATLEDAREKGELQRSYYSLLHCIVHQSFASSLVQASPQVLDSLLTALAKGAATHVDASVRRTCIQVLERLLSDWCSTDSSELVPGFKAFVVQQLGGHACIVGIFGSADLTAASRTGATAISNGNAIGSRAAVGHGALDARDAATVSLLGEAASALKLLHQKCGDDFLAHLLSQVFPGTGLPSELQQQLAYHIRDDDAKQLKDFMREVLLSIGNARK
eukprot:GHRR01008022.1.p1 GENE.GHRR01008022.1~~GHRR01008022.1.p1  ORF type:complete len:244 (+),score=108.64 GHRR01008022.1:34-732(+)